VLGAMVCAAESGMNLVLNIGKCFRRSVIITKGEQILLVQRDYVPFGILIDDTVGDDDRSAFVRVAGAVERGVPGKN
jgi:hypothetical protein